MRHQTNSNTTTHRQHQNHNSPVCAKHPQAASGPLLLLLLPCHMMRPAASPAAAAGAAAPGSPCCCWRAVTRWRPGPSGISGRWCWSPATWKQWWMQHNKKVNCQGMGEGPWYTQTDGVQLPKPVCASLTHEVALASSCSTRRAKGHQVLLAVVR